MGAKDKGRCGCCGANDCKCTCASSSCSLKHCDFKGCVSLILGVGIIAADVYFHFWGSKPWDNGIAAVGALFILLSSRF